MSNYVNLLDIVYPVSSMYFSFSSTSPSSIVGGTWTRLSNRVIRASDNTLTGGIDTQSKNFDHNHYMSMDWEGKYSFTVWTSGGRTGINVHNGDAVTPQTSIMTSLSSTVSGNTHVGESGNWGATPKPLSTVTWDNLPAYQNCYVWYRTA